jgi:hypothetical protein
MIVLQKTGTFQKIIYLSEQLKTNTVNNMIFAQLQTQANGLGGGAGRES